MDAESLLALMNLVVLKDGRVHRAKDLSEASDFDDSGDRDIAVSSVGPITISTALLMSFVSSSQRESMAKIPGEEVDEPVFETMIMVERSGEVLKDDRRLHETIDRHRSITEAVLYHLSLRERFSKRYSVQAQWKAKPYRVATHGEPSQIVSRLLNKGQGNEA
jgi:hypothetical protein